MNPETPTVNVARRPILTPTAKKRLLIFGGLLIVFTGGLIAYQKYYLSQNPTNPNPISLLNPAKTDSQSKETIKKEANYINGELVSEPDTKKYPLAVMVENHPDARPQSGLTEAAAVYEAITEGGITRFMAIFGPNAASQVGPVRSARTFFIDYASEYKAYYAHAGGAADALLALPASSVYDLPHTNGYFKRIARGNVASEHTLYTSTDDLYRFAKAKNYPETISIDRLAYKDDESADKRGPIAKIDINFSTPSYEVSWKYDKTNNFYAREMAGVAHRDRINNKQITAKVIVIMEVARKDIQLPGAKATFKFTTLGQGQAKVYQDGQEIVGTWRKASQSSRTRFYSQDNKEILLNRGQIWYEIVPPGTPVNAS